MFRLIARFVVPLFLIPTVLIAGVSLAPSASAAQSYAIAWTGIGIYPRVAPSMDSERVGTALMDGTTVSIECETTGQSVDNGFAPTDIWERLSDGTYLPNAFISTGVDGWTPDIPRCEGPDETAAPSVVELPKEYWGLWIPNDRVSTQLINHYYSATGDAVVIDWSYFLQSSRLVGELKQLEQPLGWKTYEANPIDDGDIFYGLGAFTIARTSEHCYAVKDSYDFTPDKLTNWPYIFNWADAQTGYAADFVSQSSGCIY